MARKIPWKGFHTSLTQRFEVAQAKQTPIVDIVTWTHCYARYTAAMAAKYPECTGGFMAHLVTVLKDYVEVEDLAWRVYDEVYREKMAATGCRAWTGMDVQLYQEVCAGQPRRGNPIGQSEARGSGPVKRPKTDRPVCWLFNAGNCPYRSCKFMNACAICQGGHPKMQCRVQRASQHTRNRQ